MPRTYEQMVSDALAQRQKMIDEGRDPLDGIFVCTEWEKLAILDQPPFMVYELNAERDRICGMKLALIDGSSHSTAENETKA